MKNVITRQKKGKGFVFLQNDKPVKDKTSLEWIKSLAIPPAWNDVAIVPDPQAKILARGRDHSNRLQAIYNPAFRARQERKKFSRILEFAEQLPRLRQKVEADLRKRSLAKDKVVACVVKLIDTAYFRVGNPQYAKQNNSYGITTMRSKHLDVTSYSVTFDFMGKSGKHHVKKITDRTLARIIKQLDETPGQEIFRYQDESGGFHTVSSADVNEYIKTIMGEGFTAKDFRTWGGTLAAIEALTILQPYSTERERKKAVTACVKKVAGRLGNTPAVARASYIDPIVFKRYLSGHDFAKAEQTIAGMRPRRYVSNEERYALQILRS